VSSMVSTSPIHTQSDRTWVSGPITEHHKPGGQPWMTHVGSLSSRPSTSTEWELMSVSDNVSVPDVHMDQNKYRAAFPPMNTAPALDIPPVYML
jgi:hypothetical protein